ncbi:C-GCAxxG-C-C family protein [bacterium]|nr:C-GCAxxG-C-C family protein [bacterium]MBU1881168.1 C-GCAxxG-C-C family protein [bacterium]
MKNKGKMKRRTFLKLSAGAATASAAALMLNSERLFNTKHASVNNSITVPQDAKKVFSKCGACSNTFFTLLNREFGYPKNAAELASDPLAGGLMNTQNQCGMLWGSTLAVGAESFRRHKKHDQALAMAITGSQHIVESFSRRAKSVNCRNIIGLDFSNRYDIVEFALKSLPGGYKNMICMNLAEKWAPEAIQSAKEGLSDKQTDLPQLPASCASECAKKMGASDEEMVMVAGFAGGIGLSGNACGALGSAIWMNTLAWCRKNPGKSGYSNPNAKEILKAFFDATDHEILCHLICGQRFETIADHTEFIKNGGCDKLMDVLAQS